MKWGEKNIQLFRIAASKAPGALATSAEATTRKQHILSNS